MGIILPKLTEREIQDLGKDLTFELVLHGVISESELDTKELNEYKEYLKRSALNV